MSSNMLKKSFIGLILVSTIAGGNLLYFHNRAEASTSQDSETLVSNSKKVPTIEEFRDRKVKTESYTGLDKAMEKASFKAKFPDKKKINLNENSVVTTTRNDGDLNDSYILSSYKTNNDNLIVILQTEETGRPTDMLNDSTKSNIKGTDVCIYDPTGKGNKL